VPIQRPRLRSRTKKEVPLGSYEMFQRSSLLDETVWQKIVLGLTMRSYKEVVQQFAEAYGLEKSTTCEHFVEASRAKLVSFRQGCEMVSHPASAVGVRVFRPGNRYGSGYFSGK
jgi:hypothetical protein